METGGKQQEERERQREPQTKTERKRKHRKKETERGPHSCNASFDIILEGHVQVEEEASEGETRSGQRTRGREHNQERYSGGTRRKERERDSY